MPSISAGIAERRPAGSSGPGRHQLRIFATGALSGDGYGPRVGWVLDRYLTAFREICEHIVVIEGGLSGVDRLAREWAATQAPKVEHAQFSPKWAQHGSDAIAIANLTVFDLGRPDVVLVFHDDLRSSQRTRDVLRRARARGVCQDIYVAELFDWEARGLPFRLIDPPPDRTSQRALFEGWGAPSKTWLKRTDELACTLFDPWDES